MPDRQRKVGLERNRRVVFGDRLVESAEVLQHDAEIVQELGVAGVDRAGLLVVFQRFPRPVCFLKHQPDALERFEMLWRTHQDALQQCLRLVVAFKLNI